MPSLGEPSGDQPVNNSTGEETNQETKGRAMGAAISDMPSTNSTNSSSTEKGASTETPMATTETNGHVETVEKVSKGDGHSHQGTLDEFYSPLVSLNVPTSEAMDATFEECQTTQDTQKSVTSSDSAHSQLEKAQPQLLGMNVAVSIQQVYEEYNTASDFNDSVEPMDIDIVDDAPEMPFGPADSESCGNGDNHSNEAVISENPMSTEDSAPAVAPVAAAVTAAGNLPTEERPVCAKGAYPIDWDNFDENAVPCPFGSRTSSTGKGASTTKRVIKKPAKVEGTPQSQTTMENTKAEPDKNANEVKTSKTQEEKPIHAGNADDLKNSNLAENGETGDTQVNGQQKPVKAVKDTSARNTAAKTVRPSAQQTAVVAPTVHVAAVAGTTSDRGKTAASTTAPTKKCHAATSNTIANAPSATSRAISPRTGKGEECSASDEEFVIASADPFNDTAAFEYLQQAGGRGGGDSDLHRQSLYVNFDPLIGDGDAGRVSMGQPPRPSNQSTGRHADDAVSVNDITFTESDDLLLMNTPSPARGSSRSEEPPSTVVKNKRGPKAPADDSLGRGDHRDADRLLGTSPSQASNSPSVPSTGNGQEAKLQFQALLLAKEREFALRLQEEKDKRAKLEQEMATVTKEAETAKLNAAEMSFVVAEYEKTVRQLIGEKDKPKQNRASGDYELVIKERDQALDDLQTVENAFSELNRRYETLRSGTIEFKKNEDQLKISLQECQQKLRKAEEKFNKLYSHAEHKLDLANQEIERLQKAKETDTLALRALVKKRELQVETLEKNLEQKQKEIQELTAICDELIQKAGGH